MREQPLSVDSGASRVAAVSGGDGGSVGALARWLIPAAVVALLDQATKSWVVASLAPGEAVAYAPFFKLVLWFNSGAAFSFLAGASGWQRIFFIAIALVAAVVITWLLYKHSRELLFCAGLSLILGGALGNLWDRIMHGQVVDFLLFHAGEYAWPAFNVADSAITVGAALIIIDGFRSKERTLSNGNE